MNDTFIRWTITNYVIFQWKFFFVIELSNAIF
jgi:hypothetical protein